MRRQTLSILCLIGVLCIVGALSSGVGLRSAATPDADRSGALGEHADADRDGRESGSRTRAGRARAPVSPVDPETLALGGSIGESEALEAGDVTELYFVDLTEDLYLRIDGERQRTRLQVVDPGAHHVVLFSDKRAREEPRELGSMSVTTPAGARTEVSLAEFGIVHVCMARSSEERLADETYSRGGRRTRTAVGRGVRWLARHARSTGGWSAASFDELCRGGTCDDTGRAFSDREATALCALAYFGLGTTHQTGEYRKSLNRGLRWLRGLQDADGWFSSDRDRREHALVSVAVLQAFSATGSRLFRERAERALAVISRQPNSHDLEVAAWEACAVHVAGRGAIAVVGVAAARERVVAQLVAMGSASARSLREAALLLGSRALLSSAPAGDPELIAAATSLTERLQALADSDRVDEADPLACYFGAIGAIRLGGAVAKPYVAAVESLLADRAVLGGSWNPGTDWATGARGDRLTTTALNTLALALHYRYPLVLGAPPK